MKHFSTLIALLRDRQQFFDEIRQNYRTEKKIGSLLIASSTFLAIYGAIIGSSSGGLQILSSAIKLPALYLITLTICLPTLYFFDILFGSALAFGQYTVLVLISISVISVLLFSFAPITLFFLISIHDYNFFLLLNVAIFGFTGLMGVRFFYQAMQTMDRLPATKSAKYLPEAELEYEPSYEPSHGPSYEPSYEAANKPGITKIKEPQLGQDDFVAIDQPKPQLSRTETVQLSNQRTRRRLLQFWLVLYALVGSQLGWTLRPFFGAPGEPFQLFRNIEGNFYAQVFRALFTLLGWN
ncbi:MAG: actin-binding WH2 domain-containing protein [Elainella sp.]